MFLGKRLKITVVCLLLASSSISVNLNARENRLLPVLGAGLMAIGSPIMIAGFSGYGALKAVEKATGAEIEQGKIKQLNKLEELRKEAFDKVREIKEHVLGPAEIPLDKVSLSLWISGIVNDKGETTIKGSGRKIKDIILGSLNDKNTSKRDNEFSRDFLNLPEVWSIIFEEEKPEGSLLEIDDLRVHSEVVTNSLDDIETFIRRYLIPDGQLQFERMLRADRMLIQYNEKQLSDLNEELLEIDQFAVLEIKERSLYAERKKYIKNSERNLAKRLAIEDEEQELIRSFEAIEENIESDAHVEFTDRAALNKILSYLSMKLGKNLDELNEKLEIIKFRIESEASNPLASDLLTNLNAREGEITALISAVEKQKKRINLNDSLQTKYELVIECKYLEEYLRDLQAQRTALIDRQKKIDEEELVRKNSLPENSRHNALLKLEKSGNSSLFEEVKKAVLQEDTEMNKFAELRKKWQDRKNKINLDSSQIRTYYFEILMKDPHAPGQRYFFDLVKQMSELVKKALILETVPKFISLTRESTKDIFAELGHTIGSDYLARNIAIPLEASLKKAIWGLEFYGSYFLQTSIHSLAEGIKYESLESILSSSLKNVDRQVSDLELIDDTKQQYIEHYITTVIDEQMSKFVAETEKIVVFESLHLSALADEQSGKLEEKSAEGLEHVYSFADNVKKYSVIVGTSGTALMTAGAALMYFSSSSK